MLSQSPYAKRVLEALGRTGPVPIDGYRKRMDSESWFCAHAAALPLACRFTK